MINIQQPCSYITAILLLCHLHHPVHAIKQPHHHVGFYIENFGGRVDPETLPHVYQVFASIRSASEVNDRYQPQLVIIKDLPGPPAFVLPDGNLVLTQEALDVIYKDVPLWEGNTRLAFVLGHELAHLASEDSWNAEVKYLIQSKALSGDTDDSLLDQIEQGKEDLMEVELKADDKGFLYAAIAGFPVEVLLTHNNDFLSYWVTETKTGSSKMHPEAIQRTELLRLRLLQKKDALEFFYMGVRLARFGRYQDAIYFFSEFRKVFPSREVLNNLGICYLQMAIKKMPPKMAYQYWLPSIFDNETWINRSDVLPIFRSSKQIKIAKKFLETAKGYLKKATEKDPTYSIGYINLAVAHFYLDEIYKARAAIEQARILKPDDFEVESLRALILFKEGQQMDTWSYAEDIFSELAGDPYNSLPLSFYYNWARLLEARGRSAVSQWQKLTKHKNELPGAIAHMLCERLQDTPSIEQCLEEIKKPVAGNKSPFSEQLPIRIGFDSWKLKETEHPLYSWQKLTFDWPGADANSGILYRNPQNDVVLEMDGVVEMVILKQKMESSENLLQKYGKPHDKKIILNGEIWFYDHWAVLLNQNKIKELWVVRKLL